jgi:tripartite-type tricarboxylate transporter receptor subunit TctC
MISIISRRGFLATTGAAALSVVGHGPGFAQQFPARGLLVIVPYAAGGGSDVSARVRGSYRRVGGNALAPNPKILCQILQ